MGLFIHLHFYDEMKKKAYMWNLNISSKKFYSWQEMKYTANRERIDL